MNNTGKQLRLTSLAEVPRCDWTGYVWLSNEAAPRVLQSDAFDLAQFETPDGPTNPFIVEANLYCEATNQSLAIRHVDGAYLLNLVDWSVAADGEIEESTILGHSAFKGRKLTFRQAWIPKPDSACKNMSTLVPAWVGFVGFEEGGANNA